MKLAKEAAETENKRINENLSFCLSNSLKSWILTFPAPYDVIYAVLKIPLSGHTPVAVSFFVFAFWWHGRAWAE